ncbi:lamin tail domain-containing protein [Echinicola salinicaeni]|uniref:lamin tail domain-containing protein n=1 Tax=Echinicola salinicaeni TaxID=2762757 RepID=UPI0016442991|nr:lamin tail domain-containing protein [Echinicola salinicaeni]
MKTTLTFILFLFATYTFAQDLSVYHIDVNQASATLFVTDTGESLLIDCGLSGGAEAVFAAMQAAGISQIDQYITTHYHDDHYGGIDNLILDYQVPVIQAYDRGDKGLLGADKLSSNSYQAYDLAIGNRATPLRAGQEFQLSDLRVLCVASGGSVIGDNQSIGTDENDLSIALLINFRGFMYFVGGDIHDTVENRLAELNLVQDVDVYLANHHGSKTSSSSSLLDDMKPSVIVISNGNNNRYGHPQQSSLDRMQSMNPAPEIFQINKFLGNKEGGTNISDEFIADLDPDGYEGTIKIILEGDEYTLSFGNTQHEFNVKNPLEAVGSPALFIHSLIPDPLGNDLENESVTLLNASPNTVDLEGWRLRDASSRNWLLNGSIASGQQLTISRNGQSMSLNNEGDLIELINPIGDIVDSFRYLGAVPNATIQTGH